MNTVGFFYHHSYTVANEGCVVVTAAFMGTEWLDRWREIQGRKMKRKV
jgi:hypothetical protein